MNSTRIDGPHDIKISTHTERHASSRHVWHPERTPLTTYATERHDMDMDIGFRVATQLGHTGSRDMRGTIPGTVLHAALIQRDHAVKSYSAQRRPDRTGMGSRTARATSCGLKRERKYDKRAHIMAMRITTSVVCSAWVLASSACPHRLRVCAPGRLRVCALRVAAARLGDGRC